MRSWAVQTRGKKILVCDDERPVAEALRTALEQAGYVVVTALGGEEGLAKVASEKPDLIVVDRWMPGVDGAEVVERLQADPELRDIPVICMEIKRPFTDVDGWHWQRGVAFYVTKPIDRPFNPISVLEVVEPVLLRASRRRSPPEPWRMKL